MIHWENIEASREYRRLSPQDRLNAKLGWFKEHVEPSAEFQALPEEDRIHALNGFFQKETTDGIYHGEKDDSYNITRGFKAGGLQTAAVVPAVGSMAAKAVGWESGAETMAGAAQGILNKAAKYQPDTTFEQLVDDPSIEGAVNWAMYTIGNLAPTMAVGFGGAGAGAKIGSKLFLKNAIKKAVAGGAAPKKAAEELAKKIAVRGAQAGVVGSTAPMEAGHMYMTDVEKHGVENASPGKAAALGTVAGLVELGVGGFGKGHMRIIEKFFGKAAKEAAEESPQVAWRMLKEAEKQSGGEAFQELTQEELAILNEGWTAAPGESFDNFSRENVLRMAESAAGGGLMGGGTGLLSGALPGKRTDVDTGDGRTTEIKTDTPVDHEFDREMEIRDAAILSESQGGSFDDYVRSGIQTGALSPEILRKAASNPDVVATGKHQDIYNILAEIYSRELNDAREKVSNQGGDALDQAEASGGILGKQMSRQIDVIPRQAPSLSTSVETIPQRPRGPELVYPEQPSELNFPQGRPVQQITPRTPVEKTKLGEFRAEEGAYSQEENEGQNRIAPEQVRSWLDRTIEKMIAAGSESGGPRVAPTREAQATGRMRPDMERVGAWEEPTLPPQQSGRPGIPAGQVTDKENLTVEAEVAPKPDFDTIVADAQRWRGAARKASGLIGEDKKAQLRHSKETTKGDLDAYLMRKHGIDETTARDVSNELTRRNLPDDETANIDDFAGETWADRVLSAQSGKDSGRSELPDNQAHSPKTQNIKEKPKRKSLPLSYESAGEKRNVEYYMEYKGFKVAHPSKEIFHVIDQDNNVVGQFSGRREVYSAIDNGAVQQTQKESAPQTPKRGKPGMMLSAGEKVLTVSGRETSSFPNIDTKTNRKASNTLKRVDNWLVDNAIEEARSRGDNFNLRQFEGINRSNISQADKDGAEFYLFNEEGWTPPIQKPIMKPLAGGQKKLTNSSNEGIEKEETPRSGRGENGIPGRTPSDESGRPDSRIPEPRQVVGVPSSLDDRASSGMDRGPVQKQPGEAETNSISDSTESQPDVVDSEEEGRTRQVRDRGRGNVEDSSAVSGSGASAEGNVRKNAKQDSRVEREFRLSESELKEEDRNHIIAPDDVLFPLGDETKIQSNIKAIRLLKKLEDEGYGDEPEGAGPEQYSTRTEKAIHPWSDNFPKITVHTNASTLTRKNREDHQRAKAGDEKAAIRLIKKLMKPERVRAIADSHPGAVVVPVIAVEETGKNKLPLAYALAFEGAGLEIEYGIIQSNRAFHTNKTALERLFSPAEFSGRVIGGKEYILVDDVATTGDTLNSLRLHIEKNGGKVVHISTIAYAQGSTVIAIRPETIRLLEEKHGRQQLEVILSEYGAGASALEELTESQGQYLSKFGSIDAIRNRISQAGIKRKPGENAKDDEYYSQKVTAQPISLKDVQELFSPEIKRGARVGLSPNGVYWVKTPKGNLLTIETADWIDEDTVAFKLGRGRMKLSGEVVTGKYHANKVVITHAGGKWTLAHEAKGHWFEDIGAITPKDAGVLRRHIRRLYRKGKFKTDNESDVGGAEDRANFIANGIYKTHETRIQEIFDKIKDFLDRFVNLFNRTARGVVRDVKSGKAMLKERLADIDKNNADTVNFSINRSEKQKSEVPSGKATERSRRLQRAIESLTGKKFPGDSIRETPMPDNPATSAAKRVAEVFGKKIVFFTNSSPDITNYDGVVIGNDRDHIYINANTDRPYMTVCGHELLHHLKSDSPEIYDDFLNSVFDQAKDAIDKYQSGLNEATEKAGYILDTEGAIEELLADFVGEQMTERVFWNKIAEKNPGIFKKILPAIKKFFDNIAKKLKPEELVSPFFSDIQQARDAAVQAFSDYAESKNKTNQKTGGVKFSIKKNLTDQLTRETLDVKANWKTGKKDVSIFDTILSTPGHHWKDIEALDRMYKHTLDSQDNFYDIQHALSTSADGESMIGFYDEFVKADPKEYEALSLYVHHRDVNNIRYRVKEDGDQWVLLSPEGKAVSRHESEEKAIYAGMYKEINDFANRKWSKKEELKARILLTPEQFATLKNAKRTEQAVRALLYTRIMNDREYEMDMAAMREIKERAEEEAKRSGYKVEKNPAGKWNVYKGDIQVGGVFDSKNKAWASIVKLPEFEIRDDNGEKTQIDFYEAMGEMGDLRGGYMPRMRKPGRFVLLATKEGENPIREHFDLAIDNPTENEKVWKNILNAPLPIKKRDRELRRKGYKTTIKRSEQMSEDLFRLIKPAIASFNLINEALEGTGPIKGIDTLESMGFRGEWGTGMGGTRDYILKGGVMKHGYDKALESLGGEYRYREVKGHKGEPQWKFKDAPGDIEDQISRRIFEMNAINPDFDTMFISQLRNKVSDIFKARGARSDMIKRKRTAGKDVWLGFEADLRERMTQSMRMAAAGESKLELSRNLFQDITGTWESWDDYKARLDEDGEKASWQEYKDLVRERSVEPGKQKQAYKEATVFIEDVLKNQEFADRALGILKGAAVFKYLAFRVFSAPLVNLTALATSVPAVMKGVGKIDFKKTGRLLARGGKYYITYRWGDKSRLPADIRALLDYIKQKGWAEPQYDREALSVMRSKLARSWDKVIDIGMFTFSASETFNRAATIVGSYLGLVGQGKGHEEALKTAKEISDKAHGVYHKANIPHVARKVPLLKSFYVFKTFSHNYLLTMKHLGLDEKEAGAVAWMVLSPAVLAGAGATVAMPVLNALGMALGIDDPEEEVYKQLEENFGEFGERLGRHGLFGLANLNLKGSLAIDVGVSAAPTTFKELFGAPAGVLSDIYQAGENLSSGNVMKAAEKALPLGFASIVKGIREASEGVTTGTNAPVFYGSQPLKPSWDDTIVRIAGFNPARMAGIREKQWKEKQMANKYSDRRSEIYASLKQFYLLPVKDRTKDRYAGILEEITDYNERAKSNGQMVITAKSIQRNLKRAFRPNKTERQRYVQ